MSTQLLLARNGTIKGKSGISDRSSRFLKAASVEADVVIIGAGASRAAAARSAAEAGASITSRQKGSRNRADRRNCSQSTDHASKHRF